MGLKELNIVIWCGNAANQKALANKIAKEYKIAGIVIDTHTGGVSKKKSWINLPAILLDRFRFRKIYGAWKNLMSYYDSRFPQWPDAPTIKVASINSAEAEAFTKKMQPDLIVVSGTALIKEPLLSIGVPVGIINLHTGLSPYVKGGPNCTNWCIANNTFHLVGNTIMWLNAGIDTGNIITTETVQIRKAVDLNAAHQIVMEHAHDLYLQTIRYLAIAQRPYNSVPQKSISEGQLFLTKMWTKEKRKELLRNWKKRHSFINSFQPNTVSLKDGKIHE